MIHPFSLSPSLLTLNTLAGKKAELCIQTYPNLRITCATAYERRLPLNEHQCGDLCLKVFARTCQYNRMRKDPRKNVNCIVFWLHYNENILGKKFDLSDYEQFVYHAFSGRRIMTTKIEIVGEDRNSTSVYYHY
ncbi:unnamed protein product, partial [Brugia timori]|uniref:Apple domain-containing protein n=1 Tax=Brugia timori TaxID=42155 RepID=A0A0R3R1X3_9BILA